MEVDKDFLNARAVQNVLQIDVNVKKTMFYATPNAIIRQLAAINAKRMYNEIILI